MKKDDKASKIDKSDLEQKTRALLESVSSDIKRIAEAQSSTGAQIAEIRANMATKSEVNAISMAVITLSGDLKALDDKVKAVDSKVNILDSKVNAVDSRLKAVENKLDKNLSNHETRITKLEEKVLV